MRCSDYLAESQMEPLVATLEKVFDDSVPIASIKEETAALLAYAFEHDTDFSMHVCEALLPRIARKGPAMYEQGIRVREILADHYESRGRYHELKNVLTTIPVMNGIRSSQADFQLAVALRLIKAGLDNGDLFLAETNVPKALAARKGLTESTPESDLLLLKLTQLHAQVLDNKRKFFEAGLKYHEWSTHCSSGDEEDAMRALKKAVVCAVLCDAGPQRSKLLAVLVKDDRIENLGDLSQILHKVHASRILRPADVSVVDTYLEEHQRSVNVSGQTCLLAAVAQHNLQAVSRFYANIRLSELGELLGIENNAEAERIAAQMIGEGRLTATIDQVDNYLYFTKGSGSTLSGWDAHILETCNAVASISTSILMQHPSIVSSGVS